MREMWPAERGTLSIKIKRSAELKDESSSTDGSLIDAFLEALKLRR
jgi:hypothetical protein